MNLLFLNRKNLIDILSVNDVINEVRNVYKLKANNETVVWPLVSYDFIEQHGIMDIRSGYVKGRSIHGLKMLNNFPLNANDGLPTFNGMLVAFDSNTGIPLAVMDAAYITCLRTGAAGAIGASLLARKNSKKLLVLGAGKQAIFQIASILTLNFQIETIYIADPLSNDNAHNFVKTITDKLDSEFNLKVNNIQFIAVDDLETCVNDSDIIITITPSKNPLIKKEWLKKGCHISCIGADMEDKQELDSNIFTDAKVYTDDTLQCIKVGELEIPIQEKYINKNDIIGEIGELIDNKIKGRTSEDEITIFDATGLALLDLVVAKLAIEYAQENGIGTNVEM